MSNPTKEEIRNIAQKAVSIFRNNGLTCCLFGGAACELYGGTRSPNDVDIIIMTSTLTTEDLKNMLTRNSSQFYTRAPRTPGAQYRVLFSKLPSSPYTRKPRSCKVDVLIPGIMNIPHLPSYQIEHIGGLPVLPFFALLIMKVQGWSDHRNSTRFDYNQKQHQDKRDIAELLQIGYGRGETASKWRGHGMFALPKDFWDRGLQLINAYVGAHGGVDEWVRLELGTT